MLVESLRNQPPHLYELIVVDNYEDRPRRGTVPEYILRNNIPLRAYVTPSIPPGTPNKKGMARAYNAGALWATTDHIVIVNDFCWFPPGWACQWYETICTCQANTMISGTASLHRASSPHELGDISIWIGENPCWWHVGPELELWTPKFFETFHSYFPVHFFEATNGLDERKSIEAMGEAMFAQSQMLGYQRWVEPKIRIGMIDHRAWGGEIWSGVYPRKSTPEPEIDIQLVSPNPYCFKDIRDDLLGKEWNGVMGI